MSTEMKKAPNVVGHVGTGVEETIAHFSSADYIAETPTESSADTNVVAVDFKRKANDPNNCGSPKTYFLAEHCRRVLFQRDKFVRYAGEYWLYEDGRFSRLSEEKLRIDVADAMSRWYFNDSNGNRIPMKGRVTGQLVRSVIELLTTPEMLVSDDAQIPQWRGGLEHTPASEFVSVENGLLHIPTRILYDHDPSYFTTTCLPFAYDAEASIPSVWLTEFLQSSLPGTDGAASIDLLGEFFGYCLTSDMRHQKMLCLIGKKRSGKGTVLRTLGMLLGSENTCSPTVEQLSNDFGLSGFIGKRVATFCDAIFPQQQSAIMKARLLAITGNDPLDVNRKHKSILTDCRLNTKIVIASNEVPKLRDPAGALASRMLVIDFRKSFYGMEDRTLEERIFKQLPGIFNWALDGDARLRGQGRFTETKSRAFEQFCHESDPVGRFLSERCQLAEKAKVATTDLFNAWRDWCIDACFGEPKDEAWLGRELRKDSRYIERKRASKPDGAGKRSTYYEGIALLPSRCVTA